MSADPHDTWAIFGPDRRTHWYQAAFAGVTMGMLVLVVPLSLILILAKAVGLV